jgi:hypothetical protein
VAGAWVFGLGCSPRPSTTAQCAGMEVEVASPACPHRGGEPEPRRSVWERIEDYLAPQEVYGVRRLVGEAHIERNEELWRERDALEEVLDAAYGRFHERVGPRPAHWQERRMKLLLANLDTAARDPRLLRGGSRPASSSRSSVSGQFSVRSAPDALEAALCGRDILMGSSASSSLIREAIIVALDEEAESLESSMAELRDLLDRAADAVVVVKPSANPMIGLSPERAGTVRELETSLDSRPSKSVPEKLRDAIQRSRDVQFLV